MPIKLKASDLAILGGSAAYQEKVHVGRPNIPDQERFFERVRDMFDRRWLSNNGFYVQELERELCRFLDVKHCIAVCNGTIGLEIAIRALGLKGEVIVPSFTFIATAHALEWQQVKPAFCEVDPHTHLLDPESVERAITPRTTAIIPVHIWGQAAHPEVFTEIAKRHRLKLLFDAAHAFGCSHSGTMIGNFGDAEVYSFHATKFFNTFEGGAIATNDDELAQSVRLMKNFGFAGYDNAVLVGTNGKMTEVSAAMGLTSLESLDEVIAVNKRNYNLYADQLNGLTGVRMLKYDDGGRHSYQHIVLDIDPQTAGLSRDEIMKVLWAENVLARRYFYPGCHRMQPYCAREEVLLPITDRVSAGVLVLPTGQTMGVEDVKTICSIIRLAFGNASQLRGHAYN